MGPANSNPLTQVAIKIVQLAVPNSSTGHEVGMARLVFAATRLATHNEYDIDEANADICCKGTCAPLDISRYSPIITP